MHTALDRSSDPSFIPRSDPSNNQEPRPVGTLTASLIWNAVVVLASIALALSLAAAPDPGNLGSAVKTFLIGVALVPAGVALAGSVGLWRRQGWGRYAILALYFVGLAVSAVGLLHVWGVFLGFEAVVDGIMRAPWAVLGLPVAYALFRLSGRLDRQPGAQRGLELAAFAIVTVAVVVILLSANILDGASAALRTYEQLPAWVLTVALILFGVLGYRLLNLGDYYGERPDQRVAWQGWLMLSPNILGFIFFFAGPLLLSLYLSFTDSSVGRTPQFQGLANYGEILGLEFRSAPAGANLQSAVSAGYSPLGAISLGGSQLVIGAQDRLFWISLRNTLYFCLLLIPLSTIPALGLSLVLNSKLPGVKFFRAVYFLPSVAAVVGTTLIWRWLFDPTIGFINYTILSVVNGLNAAFGLNLQNPAIAWVTGPGVVLFSIVIIAVWQVIGYNTVLFLAGLQGIPRELYEAAMIDGAGRWGQFRHVTLPMLTPATFFVVITTMITGLQVFNEPYTLFVAEPIPENVTTAVYYLYQQGFKSFQFGYASAVAWVLFGIIFLLTLAQFRASRSAAYE